MESKNTTTTAPEQGDAPATSVAPSWNPALRHEKEERPALATRPPTQPEPESSEEEEEEEEEDGDEDEDDESEEEEDEEAPVPLRPNATEAALVSATQALNIESHAPTQAMHHSDHEESDEESEEESSEDEPVASEPRPAGNYEHQGEATALEDAVSESVKVPLVDDTEATTDDWGASDDTFDLDGPAQVAPLETPQAEAVGTTVGDNVIGNTRIGGNAGDDLVWGNAEDQDDFFGSKTVEAAQAMDESPGAHVVGSGADPAAKSDWDLDLDLDDDFLPDKETAPVFELSDDEGFLEDESPAPVQSTRSESSSVNRYAPQSVQAASSSTPTSPYAPHSPQFANLPKTAQQKSVSAAYNGFGQNVAYQQQPRPPMASSAQSFADKAKGGYASPYDMPDDIVTTRKRVAPRTSFPSAQPTPPPPPRSSSMTSNTGPPRPLPQSSMSAASMSPPSSGHSMQGQMTGLPPKPAPPAKTGSSDFFAELPMTTKPRPSGRYTPQQNIPSQSPPQHAPPQLPPKERTSSWSSLRNEVLPDSGHAPPSLREPEKLPMFPSQPSVPARTNSLPVQPPPSSRYSPAPPPSGPSTNARYSPAPPSAPTANARYSPAPPAGGHGQTHTRYASEPPHSLHRTPSQPFAPRTSSPLAFHSVPQQQEQSPLASDAASQQSLGHHVSHSADGVLRPPFRSPLEGVTETEEQAPTLSSRPPTAGRSESPSLQSSPSSIVDSPRKRANYTPQYQPFNMAPPPRSHSQSPSSNMRQPVRSLSNTEQFGPAYGMMSPPSAYGAQSASSRPANAIPHRRQASLNYEAIVPEDERAADPLQRWKGYPIFTWGMGGAVITSFPKQIPRYGGGSIAPVMKCSPGEVKVHNVKDIFALPEDVAKFPGPLKSKSKKKDVSAWLGRKIEALETQLKEPSLEHPMNQEELRRLEDKSLLWKLVQVLVENDGKLEGAVPEAATKKLLSPHHDIADEGEGSFSTAADLVGRSRSNTANLQAEPVDSQAVEDLQKMLAKGDREKAVWHAVDQRLWGHAMLLSSTLNRDVWKQVVQEFVRKEVKKVGHNNQALAVLYEVFAGNHVDCVDELVPASARAGFQMVSADGAGAAQNALQGLEKWRETLALVLNNRSDGDASALLSLGRLLAQYGRVEAAHICFIFARAVVNVSGADDAQSDLVLIGADHGKNPSETGVDLEPVLLTEVYEFALSLSAQSGSHVIPHLQNYKLVHALQLAEHGHRTDAQAYCDAIFAAMKATTRSSTYYNTSFVASLDDLSKRLSQSPKDGTSSWISKPSMDKVGSSLLSKFNSFIAGDDDGSRLHQAGGGEIGPFAKIAGDSPALTPSQSSADLYGAYAGYGAPVQPPAASNSRYAPTNAHAPRSSSEQQRSRYEPQSRPSMESSVSEGFMPMTPVSAPYSPPQPQMSPPSHRTQAKALSYSPLRAEHNTAQPSPYLPTPPVEEHASAPTFGGLHPPSASFDDPTPATNDDSFNPYEPSSTAFSYQPYNPDEEDKDDAPQPRKKKSFMDLSDDEDDLKNSTASTKPSTSSKSAADAAADAAFRKAAEADAQRDKDAAARGAKKGWFGGWFKKDANTVPGPVKAKLGEENSFVYDPELKKWVNKKGGTTEAAVSSPTPPPPRAGPPVGARSASSGAPPMGPPPSTGPLKPPTSMPRSSSMPPPMLPPSSRSSTPGLPSDTEGGPKPPVLTRPSFGAASGPPSRPGTGMSNASSIDDLLGAPQARKSGGATKKKKGGRYVDVMAQGG